MSCLPKDIAELESKIGYTFKNKSFLKEALTHSSYANEQKLRHNTINCNERLEFLGDSVLSISASRYLFEEYENKDEGVMTKLRSEIVCERALASFALKLELGDYLLLGVGEEKNGGRNSKSILSDAFEALLAAMYLDAGEDGLERAASFVLPYLKEEVARIEKQGRGHDYKTVLQQFIQQDSSAKLEYVTVGETGPDHAKTFEVEARMGSNIIGRGKGKTKREAETAAAFEALTLFGEIKES